MGSLAYLTPLRSVRTIITIKDGAFTISSSYVVGDFEQKPFLRWAGGKQRLVPQLLQVAPELPSTATYFEPFLGAASLYLAIRPARAQLSDLNRHLIEAYAAIRDEPEATYKYVHHHAQHDSRDYYYQVRLEYNRGGLPAVQAARFIYLNRACFNGIFRVNRNGEFNVPYGYKRPLKIPSISTIAEFSRLVAEASLSISSYADALSGARAGDVVYLDPPYPPLNGTSFFTHYTKERFDDKDQVELSSVAWELNHKGCSVIISNADTPLIRRLYRGWRTLVVPVPRVITCKRVVVRIHELILTNY